MTLRPYQQEAVDAALKYLMRNLEPCLIDAATGAGKSHIIAHIAKAIFERTGKKVLCLAPTGELIEQNYEKYLATGNQASMFSASVGQKTLRHPVVFGSPLTVKNRISRFCGEFGLVIVDEVHELTPTIKTIIQAIRDKNPNLRVVGLTATPYRLNEGYIFREWPNGKINTDETTRDPYFLKCVYQIGARTLIEQEYLTAPVIGQINAERYDTGAMTVDAKGQFKKEDIDRAYHGHGRETAAVVADVVAQSKDRRGVMVFAATVQHAQEVMASLPPELSAIITAETKNRKEIIKDFKAQKIKYLVNVGTLTKGFDAPHVDVVAILRKTESVALLQQIIGRGLRLFEGKTECLVLDYTTNLEDHCPDGDLFTPVVKARKAGGGGATIEVECPYCATKQDMTVRPDQCDFEHDAAGYCLDLDGNQVMTDAGPMPKHFGRRCFGMVRQPNGTHERCDYRWTSKECLQCHEPNDIAARYCHKCKGEIVNPNEKLRIEFKALKKDPTQKQTDIVMDMGFTEGISQKGNKTIRVDFETPYRSFSIWLTPESNNIVAQNEYNRWRSITFDGTINPTTVTYKKDAQSGFYRVYDYNKQHDQLDDEQAA